MTEIKNSVNLQNENIGLKLVPLILFLACLWGGNSVAMKIALQDMPPIILAGLRFAIGALSISIWGKFKKIDLKLQKNDIYKLIPLSLIFVVQISTFNLGTKYTTAGRTSVLINTNPFFVAILAHFFMLDDRLSIRKLIGLIVAFIGVIIIFKDKIADNGSQIIGDAIILFSGFLFAVLAIYTKKLMKKILVISI